MELNLLQERPAYKIRLNREMSLVYTADSRILEKSPLYTFD
jgi:hypothetical protein